LVVISGYPSFGYLVENKAPNQRLIFLLKFTKSIDI
jgi:hypothetical protein